MRAVREAAGDAPIDETEGVRMVMPDGAWVLISPDPSEAAVRLWVESDNQLRARELLATWRQIVVAAQRDVDEGADGAKVIP
jgi:mannose-1-phosphate guanylyltransferase/phosphomannomutase